MELKFDWQGKMAFSGVTPSGHKLVTDVGPSAGGDNRGAHPMEMLLGALIGGTGVDVITHLKKDQLEPNGLQIHASGETPQNHPKRFKTIRVHYDFTGELPEENIVRAIELSLNKYCSVAYSLKARITGSYSLNGGEKKLIEIETGGS